MKGMAKKIKTHAVRVSLNTADIRGANLNSVKMLSFLRKISISMEASEVKNSNVVETMMGRNMSRPILISEECLKLFSWMLIARAVKKPIRTVLPKIVSRE